MANTEKYGNNNEYGITLVSLKHDFKGRFEPSAAPYKDRIESLKYLHEKGLKTWVSMEPYPTPNLVKQDLIEILKEVSFVDKIIFGKLNYNVVSSRFKDNAVFYEECANQVIRFCEENKIDYHIKFGTKKRYDEDTEIILGKRQKTLLTIE